MATGSTRKENYANKEVSDKESIICEQKGMRLVTDGLLKILKRYDYSQLNPVAQRIPGPLIDDGHVAYCRTSPLQRRCRTRLA